MLLVYWENEEDEEGQRAQNYLAIAPTAKEKHVHLTEYLRRSIIDDSRELEHIQNEHGMTKDFMTFPVAVESWTCAF